MNEVDEINVKENSDLEQVALNNAKYSMLYDFTPHGYFTIDKEGNILELNINGYKMLGLEDKNATKSNFQRYVSHDTQSVFSEFLEKVFSTHEKQTCRISIKNQKSPEIYTQLEGMSFEGNSKCLLLAIDLTDYEMLKNKSIRYQHLFESLKNGIVIIDLKSGKITDVNHALSEIIGFDSEELMGKNLWEVPIFKDIIHSYDELADLENKLKNHYALENNNKILELELVSNTYEFDNSKEMQLNFKDITERIKYLNALEESKSSLEALNEAKNKFFSIISHDLRSPFNSIIGFTELLNEKIDKEDYANVKQFADIIQKSSWNAMDLLSNLIEWSRSQNGKIEFKPEYFNLEDLISEVFNYATTASEQKSIVLTSEVSYFEIFADRAMLNTVLRNLISNAIKFTRNCGEVKVSAYMKEGDAIVTVSDNGVGMDPQMIDRIFELGETHSTKGTRQETGSGLGLLLCKEFITKHKGKICADSTLNEGSTFYFSIPQIG